MSGCSSEMNNQTIEDKNIAELNYLESNVLKIMNKYIKNEYVIDEPNSENENNNANSENNNSGNEENSGNRNNQANRTGMGNEENLVTDNNTEAENRQNWEEILNDARKIESELSTIMVDLATLNVETEEISKLSTGINGMIIAIENRDGTNLIIELNNIYALIPNYLSKYSQNEEEVFKKQLKYYTISSYVSYQIDNYDLARSQMQEAINRYSEKMKDVNYVRNNEYNINEVYILVQELKNAVDSDSKELVRTKYLSLIERIS